MVPWRQRDIILGKWKDVERQHVRGKNISAHLTSFNSISLLRNAFESFQGVTLEFTNERPGSLRSCELDSLL